MVVRLTHSQSLYSYKCNDVHVLSTIRGDGHVLKVKRSQIAVDCGAAYNKFDEWIMAGDPVDGVIENFACGFEVFVGSLNQTQKDELARRYKAINCSR